MNWSAILAAGDIPEPPGYRETVAAMQGRPVAVAAKVQLHAKKAPSGQAKRASLGQAAQHQRVG